MKVQSSDIHSTEDMPVTVRQECFFANSKNKARLIRALADHTEMAGIEVKQAAADADTLIVRTAIDLSPTIDVVVVGTDVDLLILFLQLSPSDSHLYMFKPGSWKYPNEVYDIRQLHKPRIVIRGLCNCLLFLHAMTGSDTTSALYRQVKKKAFKLVTQNPELQTLVEVFPDSSSMPHAVALTGEEFLLALYGATSTTLSLNKHSHHCCMNAVATCPIHTQM